MELDRPPAIDLSPAATTLAFQPILPPMRVPVRAGPADDPEKGCHLLAFGDKEAWEAAWTRAEDHIISKCEMTARMGCSVNATRMCATPWWKRLLPGGGAENDCGRSHEECEEREMSACVVRARDKCGELARSACEPVFSNVLIAADPGAVHPRFVSDAEKRLRANDRRRAANQVLQSLAASRGGGIASLGRGQVSGSREGGREYAPQAAASDAAAGGRSGAASAGGRPSNVIPTDALSRRFPKVRSRSKFDHPELGRASTGFIGAEGEGWEGGLIKPRLGSKDRPRFASLLMAKDERA